MVRVAVWVSGANTNTSGGLTLISCREVIMSKAGSNIRHSLARIFCDWGWTKPTKKPAEQFMGAPAPLWDNPAPKYFLWGAVLALIIWLAMIGTMVIKIDFDLACEIERINLIKDITVIVMIFNVIYLFRMATFDRTDDRHWSRVIVIMFALAVFYLIMACLLILIKADLLDDYPSSNCSKVDKQAREVIAPLAAMVLLYVVLKVVIILKITMSLYFKTQVFLSRNRDMPGST
jgi:hypothetical protein